MLLTSLVCLIFIWVGSTSGGIKVENTSSDGLDMVVSLDGISNVENNDGQWAGIRLPGFLPLVSESLGVAIPVRSVLVGAPPNSEVTYDITDVTSYDIDRYTSKRLLEKLGDVLQVLPTKPAEIMRDGYYRHRRLLGVRITPLILDEGRGILQVCRGFRIRIRFAHDGTKSYALGSYLPSSGALRGAMLNSQQASNWLVPWKPLRQEDDYFTSSPNWIKIKVDSTGIYALTGDDLENAGIDISQIEVSSLRLYSGGGLPLSESLADTNASWMHQVALKVCDGGDGVFDRADSLIFYGLGWRDWADLYDPHLSHTSFYKSFYCSYNCYWLTWGGSFGEPANRMLSRRLPECSGCSYFEPQVFEERIHRERDLFEMFSVRAEDGWYWYYLRPGSPFTDTFRIPSPDVGFPARLRIRVASWAQNQCSGDYFRVQCHLNGTRVMDVSWSAPLIDRNIKDLDTLITLSSSGQQQIVIENRQSMGPPYGHLGICDRLILAWYEIFYMRRFEADNGSLYFDAPDTAGYVKYHLSGFTVPIYLFDVTDQFDVEELTGFEADPGSFEVTFFDTLSGYRRRYAAVTSSAMLKPMEIEKVLITNIRYSPTKAYCVVTHRDLIDAARTIADFRDGEVVSLDEIYNEFGWGLPDATAIRDFLRWRYWHGPLSWVLLLGDATWDLKGRRGQATYKNYVPSYERRYLPPVGDTYNTDDWFAYLEPSWRESLADFPTVALSRLPAISPEDAQALVERTLAYEANPEPGMWQATVILVADDDRVGSSCDGIRHTDYAEELADKGMPLLFRQVKIYLTEYEPEATGDKTAAKNDFIANLNRGALITNFVGHGDPSRLAQERVFESRDIDLVKTGRRRTFFIAASCNVSRFDDLARISMAEDLIHRTEGGTIGSLASTHLCKAEPNQALNLNFLQQLFHDDFLESPVTIGDAVAIGKFLTVASARNHDLYWRNSEMYALFGDPALTLAYPRYGVSFVQGLPDTLKRKGTYSIQAVITSSGQRVNDFGGEAEIFVREAEDTSGYIACDGHFFDYELPGEEIFRGQTRAIGGEMGFRFLVSSPARRGPGATVRCFVTDGKRSALGLIDSLTIAGDAELSDEQGPEIELVLDGRTISSGDTLLSGKSVEIHLSDSSGIAIKSLSQIYPISVAFDDAERVNLADSAFALGGDFTTWVASFIVPPLSPGLHKLSVSAFDNLSNPTTRNYEIFVGETASKPSNLVYVFPNPARDFCNFIWEYDTNDEVEIEVTIMTISGRKIWTGKTSGFGPYLELVWDCNDSEGDRVSNGTYVALVKARSLDGRGIRTTDKLVVTVMK